MSLKTTAQAVEGQAFSLPVPFSFEGFEQAWQLTNFPRGLAISTFITAVSVFGEIVISALAAFAIVRNCDRRLFRWRSEEHTSELQSRGHLVCRLLLEK